MIAATALVHDNVILGNNVTIEDFCIIGCPFSGWNGKKTVIGDNAVIRSHTVIYAGNEISSGFMTGNKANIREYNKIGKNVSIGTLSVIEHHVTIEDDVRIHSQVFVPEFTILQKGCWLGPNVVLTNAKYPCSPNVKNELSGVTVSENARIGANVTILPGIIVGNNVLVGAGSVVTKDIPKNSIVCGNPARFMRTIHY